MLLADLIGDIRNKELDEVSESNLKSHPSSLGVWASFLQPAVFP